MTQRKRTLLGIVGAVLVLGACGSSSNDAAEPDASSSVALAPPPLAVTTTKATTTSTSSTSATANPPPIEQPATASTPAVRGIPFSDTDDCDEGLIEALAARHPDVHQFITVASGGWTNTTATLELAAFDGTQWRCQLADATAVLGSNGTRPLVERRSGDGTTPAGLFPLGTQTAWDGQQFQFFGNSPDPGVRGSYRQVHEEDCWGATPNASTYQKLVDDEGCPGPDDEWLPRFGDVYSNAAVIGANMDPVSGDAPGEPPYAAAIFLHRHNYGTGTTPKSTRGCVSLPAEDLVEALQLIDPALNPHFAVGPRDWLLTDS